MCLWKSAMVQSQKKSFVKYSLSDTDIEILTVSARPYYLPREFSHMLVTNMNIPPSAKSNQSLEMLTDRST